MLAGAPALAGFLCCWIAAIVVSLVIDGESRNRRLLQAITALALLTVAGGHYALHRDAFGNPAFPAVSAALLATALLFAWPALRRARTLEVSHAR